jgi:iron-sulfur cluster assembly accessory protein
VITLTESAAVKVKELLDSEGADDLALRVAVRPGGCSGYSYEMFFDGDVAADDEQAEFGPDKTV